MIRQPKLHLPTVLVFAAPVAFWLFIIIRYAANIPWFDDFDPFPDFLRQWLQTEGFTEKLKLVFQPNNEHRMIWGKLTALVYYYLTGTLNFRAIQLIAALLTIGVLYLFWKTFKAARIPLVYFIPVPFFIFHLQYYGTYLWAICSMQHQPVVFFAALTSWLVARGRFTAGIVAALCANFAMGNGILVWTSGFAILLFLGRYRQLGIWCAVAFAGIFLYFVGMSPQGNETSFAFFASNPHLSFIGFFTFLGGLFDLSPDRAIELRSIPTFIGGFLAGVYAIVWTIRTVFFTPREQRLNKDKEISQGFLVGILVFILANAAVIALLRPRFGMDVMLVSNYKIYPGIFFAATYLSLLLWRPVTARIWKTGTVVAAGLWLGTLCIYLPTVRERANYFEINAYNQRHNQYGLGFEPGSEAAHYIASLVADMERKGIYRLPQTMTPIVERINRTPPSAVRIEHTVTENGNTLHIALPELSAPALQSPVRFFCIHSPTRNYLFKVDYNPYRGRNPLRKFEKGANLLVTKDFMEKGAYQILFYDGASGHHYSLGDISVR